MEIQKNTNIKNIIFDLGNVLLKTDLKLTINEFIKLGIKDVSESLLSENSGKFYYDFEKGLVSTEELRNKIRKNNNLAVSNKDFDFAWNKMLLSISEKDINILKKLKSKLKIILLSNTNQIHYDYFIKQKYWNEKLFEKMFFSHQIGMRKPDEEIFLFVLKNSLIQPEETLFIDDREENVLAAKKLNIRTILYQNTTLEKIFINYL